MPLRDDPPAPASSTIPTSPTTQASPTSADDLTLGADPLGPAPEPAPRPASAAHDVPTGAPPGTPLGDLYGAPYGPPPPYASSQHTSTSSEPYTATPIAPTDRRRRRQHWAGAILVVLGVLILGNNLGLLWWVEPEYILPLILVGAGAWLLFGRGRRG